MANEQEAAQLYQFQKVRRIVVFIALGLLIVSFFRYSQPLAYARAGAWVIAGIISVMEAMKLSKIGAKAGNAWINALIYFAVAILPLVRGA